MRLKSYEWMIYSFAFSLSLSLSLSLYIYIYMFLYDVLFIDLNLNFFVVLEILNYLRFFLNIGVLKIKDCFLINKLESFDLYKFKWGFCDVINKYSLEIYLLLEYFSLEYLTWCIDLIIYISLDIEFYCLWSYWTCCEWFMETIYSLEIYLFLEW